MKKILLSLLVAATLGLTATSCTKDVREVVLESSGTRVEEFTVEFENWKPFGDPNNPDYRNYYYCVLDWDILSEHVVYDGNVNVYLYDNDSQFALPYTYLVPVKYNDGTYGFAAEALYYKIDPGKVTLIMQDLDGYMPQLQLDYFETPAPMTFRVVATAPINYIIEQ